MRFLFFGIILLCYSCHHNEIKKIEIKSVDLYISTMIDIDCDNFENSFRKKIHTTVIRDKIILKKFNRSIKSLKYDATNYYPDVRSKLFIYNTDGTVDTICLSLIGIVLNGRPMKMDKEFLHLVEQYSK